jgi:putative transposase
MAIAARRPARGSLIHHSDRGIQYACGDYTALLEAHDIQPSMSRIGNPYDNAKAESFMKTLKQEEVDGRSYRDAIHARQMIGSFIEEVYNRQRLHSALAYPTFPGGYHDNHKPLARYGAMGGALARGLLRRVKPPGVWSTSASDPNRNCP